MKAGWGIRTAVAGGLVAALVIGADVAAAASKITPGHADYPAAGNTVIGLGIDGQNQNAQLSDSVPAQITASWSAAPPVCPSSAVTQPASFSVSGQTVVVPERGYQCGTLSAYDTETGSLRWRNAYHFVRSSVVVDATVYSVVQTGDGAEHLLALDLSTGAVRWDAAVSGSRTDVVVGSGIVLNGGIAFDAATGVSRFVIDDSGGFTPIVVDGTIYANEGGSVSAYSASSGVRLWTFAKPGGTSVQQPGWGVATPALHDGRLYVSGATSDAKSTTLVLDSATGALVRTLPPTAVPIAFDGTVGIFTTLTSYKPSIVTAVDLQTGATYWKHELPVQSPLPWVLVAAPIISNGLVWYGELLDTGTASHLIALDEVKGTVASTTMSPCGAGSGVVAIARHRIFLSTDCGTATFIAATATPTPTPTATPTPGPVELLSDPGFEKGTGSWTADAGSTVGRSTSVKHSGARSLEISPRGTRGTVSSSLLNAVTSAAASTAYTLSCWVRPSSSTLPVSLALTETTPAGALTGTPTVTTAPSLAPGVWTQVSVSATVRTAGDGLRAQVSSSTATRSTGGVLIDDCSLMRR